MAENILKKRLYEMCACVCVLLKMFKIIKKVVILGWRTCVLLKCPPHNPHF